MNSEADVSSSVQYVRMGMDHNWVTEHFPFYNTSPCSYTHSPLSPHSHPAVSPIFPPLTPSSPKSFISTVTLFCLTHRLITTSPPELEKQVHLCIITTKRLLGLISPEDTYPKPKVMNLNTALPLKLVSQCILW